MWKGGIALFRPDGNFGSMGLQYYTYVLLINKKVEKFFTQNEKILLIDNNNNVICNLHNSEMNALLVGVPGGIP